MKSPNYYASVFKDAKDQENRINKFKNAKPGLRDNGVKKIINIGPHRSPRFKEPKHFATVSAESGNFGFVAG